MACYNPPEDFNSQRLGISLKIANQNLRARRKIYEKLENFITFVSLSIVILGNSHSAEAQQNLAQQAYAIFEQNCLNCHGEHGAFTEEIIIEHTALIETGAVVPGKPIESELYRRLLVKDPAKRMPLGQPQLSPAAILTIGNWIQVGAPSWETPKQDGRFITPKEMLDTIEKHVNSLSRLTAPLHAISR